MARDGVPSALVLTDWHWLHETGELNPDDPLQHRIRLAAPRIGMKVDALGKALERAGIRNPVQASTQLRDNPPLSCQKCRNDRVTVAAFKADVAQIAKRLARNPDSPRLREMLERAQADLADAETWRDIHQETEHDGMAA